MKSNNILFFIIATNSDLSKYAEEKISTILNSPPISSTIYLLKETKNDKGFILLRKYNDFIDTIFQGDKNPICSISMASNYINSQSYTDINAIIFSHTSEWNSLGKKIKYALIEDIRKISATELAYSLYPLRFRNLIFESCSMGTIEDISQLYKICDYYISSTTEMLSLGFTPIYKQYGLNMLEKYKYPVLDFAKYFSEYYSSQPYPMNSYTISVIRCKTFNFLFNILRKNNKIHIYDYSNVQTLSMEGEPAIFDLSSLVKHSNLEIEVKKQIDIHLSSTVLFSNNSANFLLDYGGFSINTYCGIGIYSTKIMHIN